jgi:hypothetical protein
MSEFKKDDICIANGPNTYRGMIVRIVLKETGKNIYRTIVIDNSGSSKKSRPPGTEVRFSSIYLDEHSSKKVQIFQKGGWGPCALQQMT